MISVQTADIVLTHNPEFIGQAIRFATRRPGEPRSIVNHAGIITEGLNGMLVEALLTVKRHNIRTAYAGSDHRIAIYRPINLSAEQRSNIAVKASSYIGDSYGWTKIGLHALEALSFHTIPFTALSFLDEYPICSYLVAKAYAEAGLDFGVAARMASPDDIWDFVTTYTRKYECIFELDYLPREERTIAW